MSGTIKSHATSAILSALALVVAIQGVALAAEEKQDGWDSSVSLGASLTAGNSKTTTLNAGLTAQKNTKKDEIVLGLAANYGESESAAGDTDTTVENAKATAAYRAKFDGPYAYSDNSLLYDDIAAIDYRLILGVGFGQYLVDDEDSKLGVELGVAFVKEELADDTGEEAIFLRVAERYEQELSETARVWQSLEYLPSTEDFSDFLANGVVGIEAAINSSMSLRVVLEDRYDNTPAEGQDNNDISLIAGLTWML